MKDNKEYYNARLVFDKGRTVVWRALNDYFSTYVHESHVVLDLGCGYGDFINGIRATKKYAIDLNEDVVEYLSKDIHFKAQSVLEPFEGVPENGVDVVFASNLFEHFTDEELECLLVNVKRVLRNGGKLILMQPNIYYAYREYWDDYTHKKAFSHESLADFLRANDVQIVKVEKKFIPFSLKSRLPKSYFLTKLYLLSPIRIFAKQMLVIGKL